MPATASHGIYFSLEHIMQRKLFARRRDDVTYFFPRVAFTFNGILFLYLFAHYEHNFSFIFRAWPACIDTRHRQRERSYLLVGASIFLGIFHIFFSVVMRCGPRCFIWNIYQPFIDFIRSRIQSLSASCACSFAATFFIIATSNSITSRCQCGPEPLSISVADSVVAVVVFIFNLKYSFSLGISQ